MDLKKSDAMEYAASKQLPKLLESLLMALLIEKPDDHIQYIIKKLNELQPGATEINWKDIKNKAAKYLDAEGVVSQKSKGDSDLTGLDNQFIDMFSEVPVVLVLGGPGCGKGTQCSMLQQDLNMVHLSTGELLRENLEKSPTDKRTVELANLMSSGQLIPMEIVSDLLFEKMVAEINNGATGILIDGYPRNLEQAKLLERKVGKCTLVVYLKVSEDTMRSRISKRSLHDARSDDESSNHRLTIYNQETLPLVDHYKPIIVEIDAERDIESVYEDVKNAVNRCLNSDITREIRLLEEDTEEDKLQIVVESGEIDTVKDEEKVEKESSPNVETN
ncbi:hypothetical protein GJ496_009022 [Pomphorhynchus laevis]|nr:hypothetical protein GJ496_009022 [Pomphorhynchus laevis]